MGNAFYLMRSLDSVYVKMQAMLQIMSQTISACMINLINLENMLYVCHRFYEFLMINERNTIEIYLSENMKIVSIDFSCWPTLVTFR